MRLENRNNTPPNLLFNQVTHAVVNIPYTTKETQPKTGLKSPLRYPGGKSRAVKELIKYFPPGLDKVCSPFLGGGSLELELASKGIEVFGYDTFEPLTDFWQVLLNNPKELAELVAKFYPLTSSKFYSLQKDYLNLQNQKDKAAIFFVLNRSSFSGTTLSGGMSPDHPRFTTNIIEYLKNFEIENLHVRNADFHDSLAEHKTDFLYLDPPYAIDEKLYGNRGSTHIDFDHTGLAKILKKRDGWILSYNDSTEVRSWYKGFHILTPQWAYGMGKEKKSSELLILSKDFFQI
jgi:DNA adenine methylase